jgi:hypothetical protein
MTDTQKRFLPPDVYDALELSALAFGGIGQGEWGATDAPICIIGHAVTAGIPTVTYMSSDAIPIREDENDGAVRSINARIGKPEHSRVTFKQWCKELRVFRGDTNQ